jgi:hypothetical protein
MATITIAAPNAADTLTVGATTLTARIQRAFGTLTFASAEALDTFVVAGVTFTIYATGALLNAAQNPAGLLLAASDTLQAAAAADAINAHPVTGPLVRATYAAGVVTVVAVGTGTTGNAYTLVGGTRITASGATFTDAVAVVANEFNITHPAAAAASNAAIATDVASRLATTGYLATSAAAVVSVYNADYTEPVVSSSNGTRLAVAFATDASSRARIVPVAADPNAGGSVLAGNVGDLVVYSAQLYICTVADTTWVVVGTQT